MRAQKAVINFSRVKDNTLANAAQHIVIKMTGNTHFTAPNPSLETLQIAITLYAAALIKAKDGSKVDTADKNAKRRQLEALLYSLGSYVNMTVGSDLVKLDSSGFNLTKMYGPVGILDAPNLNINYGNNSGEVSFNISVIPKARGYKILFTILPEPLTDAEWTTQIVSKTKGILVHLKPQTCYRFKATALSAEANKMNLYNFSTPVDLFVP